MFDVDPEIKRLQFPVRLPADASIPGAIIDGVEQHVLYETLPVLREASIKAKHTGHCQFCSDEELSRLAKVLGCTVERLAATRAIRVEEASGRNERLARVDRLEIPRTFIELDRRRIAPKELKSRRYHRAGWLNILLPYSTKSGERLVDQCGRCGNQLGWRRTWGVDCCEHCLTPVAPSDEPSLTGFQLRRYRFFGDLCSLYPPAMNAAFSKLPIALQAANRFDVIDLILQLGNLVQSGMPGIVSQHKIAAMPAATLGRIIVDGVWMTKDFPRRVVTWCERKDAELRSTGGSLAHLRGRIKDLLSRYRGTPISQILADAFPAIGKYASYGLVQEDKYYHYTEVRLILGLKGPQMKNLLRWSKLDINLLSPPGMRELRQYNRQQIDELSAVLKGSQKLSAAAWTLAVPIYAIEQLCLDGTLTPVSHPAVKHIRREVQVTDESVEKLMAELKRLKMDDASVPKDAVTLSKALRAAGGGLKPWGQVFRMLLARDGQIPFWVENEAITADTILVRKRDLTSLAPTGIELRKLPKHLIQEFSQLDAAEILNISPHHLGEIGLDGKFTVRQKGLNASIARVAVLEAARRIITMSEISSRWNCSRQAAEAHLAASGLQRTGKFWIREDVARLGPPSEPKMRSTKSDQLCLRQV